MPSQCRDRPEGKNIGNMSTRIKKKTNQNIFVKNIAVQFMASKNGKKGVGFIGSLTKETGFIHNNSLFLFIYIFFSEWVKTWHKIKQGFTYKACSCVQSEEDS